MMSDISTYLIIISEEEECSLLDALLVILDEEAQDVYLLQSESSE